MERRKVCRYFERGSCKKDDCPFVHVRESRKNCQFFMQGNCKKGAKCNFYHPPKQSVEEKVNRKNYKHTFEKKQKMQVREESSDEEQYVEPKTQKQQYKKIESEELHEDEKDHGEINDKYKLKQINFLLGLGEDSSSEESQQQQIIEEVKPKRKPLNFVKQYPKKFPDYTKSVESKQKILENEKQFFGDKKFIELISKTEDPVEKEYLQLVRKFQDSFTIFVPQNSQVNRRIFLINIRPLIYQTQIMLHFQLIEDFIQMKIDASKYDQERAHFEILNMSMPEDYKQKFAQYLEKVHAKKNIFQTLKSFVNGFDKIYEEVKSKLENQYYSQIELEQKITKKLSQEKQRKALKREKKQKPTKKQNVKPSNPDVQILHFPQNEKIVVGNMNYEINVSSLLIQNGEYVVAERILLFLECTCQKKIAHILEADRKDMCIGVKLQCKKCNMIILIGFQREVMQLRSQTIGKLGIQNGRLIEVGGVSWKLGCQCDAQIIKPKLCMPGHKLNANCFQCFKSIQVTFMGLKFSNPFLKQNQVIEDGKQLPNRGACKHMKLSFRWIRYGCCGRTFSCDQCHINGSVYEHEKIQGTTMLCGYCAIEQNLGKQCCSCKRELIKGVDKNGHWEGGLGCRDKTLLSKKDAKKYTGLSKPQAK